MDNLDCKTDIPQNQHLNSVKTSIHCDNRTNVWSERHAAYRRDNNDSCNSTDEKIKESEIEQVTDVDGIDTATTSNQTEDLNSKESWRTRVSQRNLIVNYLPQHVDDKELYKIFRHFGKIQSVRVMKDLKAGYSFGFGFVNFLNDSDGEKAKHALHESKLGKKTIKVNFARAASDDTQQSNLYVSNLPRSATESDVQKMFAIYGEILQISLLRDKILDIPRGVAFIRYRERKDALRAIIGMDGVTPEGLEDPINVRIALDYGRQRAASFGTMFSMSRPKAHGQQSHKKGFRNGRDHYNSDNKAKSHCSSTLVQPQSTKESAPSSSNIRKNNMGTFHKNISKGKKHKRKHRK